MATELIAQVLCQCAGNLADQDLPHQPSTLHPVKFLRQNCKMEMLSFALQPTLSSSLAGLTLQNHPTQVWKRPTAPQEQLKELSHILIGLIKDAINQFAPTLSVDQNDLIYISTSNKKSPFELFQDIIIFITNILFVD